MKHRRLKKLGRVREAPAEHRSILGEDSWLPAPSLAGVVVTPETALRVTAVFACVNVIASSVASMPFLVSRKLRSGGREPAPDHPNYDLLACEPNPEVGANAFWTALVGNAALFGNGYAEIVRDWDGSPTALYLLDPVATQPMRDGQGRLYYQTIGGPGPNYNRPITLLPEDVIHIATISRDGIEGYGPTRMAETLIGASLAAEVTGASVFGKGGQPVGSLEAPEELDEVGRRTLRAYWKAYHSGPFNAGEPVILENGVKFNPFTVDLEKLQYNDTRRQAAKQIAQLFGVPPHKIGILDNATYGSLEEQDLDFYKSTLRIWCERIESEVCRKLFTREERREYSAQFDMNATIRGNLASLTDHLTKMFGVGAFTPNQVCQKLGLNPFGPEGDRRYIAAQLVPLDAPAQPATVPAQATPPDPGQPSDEAVSAVRSVVHDALTRCVRKEVGALRRAAKRPDFRDFASAFYEGHESFMALALAPSLRALGAVTGRAIDHSALARSLAGSSLDDLVAAPDPESLLSAWEEGKAAKVLEMLP